MTAVAFIILALGLALTAWSAYEKRTDDRAAEERESIREWLGIDDGDAS